MSFSLDRPRAQIVAGAMAGLVAASIAIVPDPSVKIAVAAVLIAIPAIWWMLREPSRWLAAFFIAALLLPPLFADVGGASPHVALLFAVFGLLAGLIHSIPVCTAKVNAALCALFAVIAASVGMAAIYSGLPIAAASMARVLLLGISVYIFFFVQGAPVPFHIVRLLFWAAAASAVFACLDFYFQFPAPAGYGPQFIWLDSGVFRRAQGVFYEASTLGNLCAFFLEMIAVALVRARRGRPVSMAAMLLGGVALGAALVLSYSRASLVNLGVALTVLAWLQRKRIRLGAFLKAAAVVAGSALAVLFGVFPLFAEAYWTRLSQSFSYLFESPNAILSGRIDTWTFLTRFLTEHPWHSILGIGYKTLPYSAFIGQTAIADNTYISMFLETGIAGLAALLVWNCTVIRVSYRASQSADPERSFCGTWMLCFWAGQVVQMLSADLLTYWRVLPVYMCVLALAVRRK